MYCTSCGKPNNDGTAFCVNCGAPLKQGAAFNPQAANQPRAVSANKDRKKLVMITDTIFAALSSVFVFVMFFIPVHLADHFEDKKVFLNGYDIIFKDGFMSRFWGDDYAPIGKAVNIGILVVSGVMFLAVVLTFLLQKGNMAVCIAAVIVNTVISGLYCLEGFLAVKLSYSGIEAETYAYMGLIIFVPLMIAFFVTRAVVALKK